VKWIVNTILIRAAVNKSEVNTVENDQGL